MFKEIFKPEDKKLEIEEEKQEFEGPPHPETPEELQEAKIAAGVTSAKEAKKREKKGDKLIKKIAEATSLWDTKIALKDFEHSVGKHPAWKGEMTKARPLEIDIIIDELKKERELITTKTELEISEPVEPDILTEEEYEKDVLIKKIQKHIGRLESIGHYFLELNRVEEAVKELNEAKKRAGVKTHEDVMTGLIEENSEIISEAIDRNDISLAKRILDSTRNLADKFGTAKLTDKFTKSQRRLPAVDGVPLSDTVKGLVNAGKFDEANKILDDIEKDRQNL